MRSHETLQTKMPETQDLQTFLLTVKQKSFVNSDSYYIFWVLEGKGEFFAEFKDHPIRDNTIYCVCPGQFHLFNVPKSIKGYVLSFRQELVATLRNDSSFIFNLGIFSFQTVTPISVVNEVRSELELLIQSMLREQVCSSPLSTEISAALLNLFLMHLTRMKGMQQTYRPINGDLNLVNQFLEMVQQNYLTMKRVAEYADKLRISSNYLSTSVKKITGFNASHHIHQRIALEAKRQARWTRSSLKEIAYQLGYDDTAHFSKFFKRTTGMTFSRFKRTGNIPV